MQAQRDEYLLQLSGDDDSRGAGDGRRADPWMEVSHDVISRFLDVLLIECGLAPKARVGYGRALHDLDRWMQRTHGCSAIGASLEALQQYFDEQAASSCSLWALKRAHHSARRFYAFLRECHYRDDDPMAASLAAAVFVRRGIEFAA